MSQLNKKEIRKICKYFFDCGLKQFDITKFNRVFDSEWKSIIKMKSIKKDANDALDVKLQKSDQNKEIKDE